MHPGDKKIKESTMQFTMHEYLAETERRRDEMARAEQERLSRLLPRRESPLRQGIQRSLAHLGGVLSGWGTSLQRRYTTTSSTFHTDTSYPSR